MPRRQYQRVSTEDRQRLVDAFRDGVDYLACAAQLGIRRGTAYSVIRRYQTTGAIGAAPRAGIRARRDEVGRRNVPYDTVHDSPR